MLFEIAGWIGTLIIVAAYLLVSSAKLDANSKVYQSLNLLGAIAVLANAWVHSAYPVVGLNLVWATIAIYGLIKSVK